MPSHPIIDVILELGSRALGKICQSQVPIMLTMTQELFEQDASRGHCLQGNGGAAFPDQTEENADNGDMSHNGRVLNPDELGQGTKIHKSWAGVVVERARKHSHVDADVSMPPPGKFDRKIRVPSVIDNACFPRECKDRLEPRAIDPDRFLNELPVIQVFAQ